MEDTENSPGCTLKMQAVEAEKTAQPLKCLSCEHEDLSLILRTHTKLPGVVVCVCIPGSGERETEGTPRAHWPDSLAELVSSRLTRVSVSQKVDGVLEEGAQCAFT